MSSALILPHPVTPQSAEWVYRTSKELAERRPYPDLGAVEKAMRILRADNHDSALLIHALEKLAECLDNLAEGQGGQTRRQASTVYSHRIPPTEVGAFREAYVAADAGTPEASLGYLYAATARFAGFII